MKTRAAALLVPFVLATTSAGAHHSPALYDLQATVTLVGSVVHYQRGNPHAYVYLTAEGADGAAVGDRSRLADDDGAQRLVSPHAATRRPRQRRSQPRP